jgi:nicotinate (nicotinamide) nucleotide adenylyltransferase
MGGRQKKYYGVYYAGMVRRIGIFSGTFDPVHHGHIAFCLEALRVCSLDEVILLPERLPRSKRFVTPLPRRAALLEKSVEPLARLSVAILDSDQFTVGQTLPELRHMFGDAELILLIGSDVVGTFLYRWEGLEELFKGTELAVGIRQGDTKQKITATLVQIEDKYKVTVRYTLIKSPYPAATSSQIRASSPNYSVNL